MDKVLYARCEQAKPTFIERWRKLVNIDSGSRYGAGIEQISGILSEQFRILGGRVEIIPTANLGEGCHTLVTFTGSGKGKILALAHVDTVFAKGTAMERPFTIEGHSAKGPGVADCKAGINLLISALENLKEMHFDNFGTITLLFNCDEEIGSPHSRHIIRELAKEHDFTLVCESGQIGDGLASCRRGSSTLKVEVQGLSCHAGHVEEPHANALLELTHQMQVIAALENPQSGTNINFTVCNCGDKLNVIPDKAIALADVRVTSAEEIVRVRGAAEESAKKVMVSGTTVRVTLESNNPPFSANPQTDKLIALSQDIYGELDKELKILAYAGGSSDANWVYEAGSIVADGFSVVKNGKNHTVKESSDVDTVVPRMYLLTRLFMELGKMSQEDMA